MIADQCCKGIASAFCCGLLSTELVGTCADRVFIGTARLQIFTQRGDLPFQDGPFALERQLLPLGFLVQGHVIRPFPGFLRHPRGSRQHSARSDVDIGQFDAGI